MEGELLGLEVMSPKDGGWYDVILSKTRVVEWNGKTVLRVRLRSFDVWEDEILELHEVTSVFRLSARVPTDSDIDGIRRGDKISGLAQCESSDDKLWFNAIVQEVRRISRGCTRIRVKWLMPRGIDSFGQPKNEWLTMEEGEVCVMTEGDISSHPCIIDWCKIMTEVLEKYPNPLPEDSDERTISIVSVQEMDVNTLPTVTAPLDTSASSNSHEEKEGLVLGGDRESPPPSLEDFTRSGKKKSRSRSNKQSGKASMGERRIGKRVRESEEGNSDMGVNGHVSGGGVGEDAGANADATMSPNEANTHPHKARKRNYGFIEDPIKRSDAQGVRKKGVAYKVKKKEKGVGFKHLDRDVVEPEDDDSRDRQNIDNNFDVGRSRRTESSDVDIENEENGGGNKCGTLFERLRLQQRSCQEMDVEQGVRLALGGAQDERPANDSSGDLGIDFNDDVFRFGKMDSQSRSPSGVDGGYGPKWLVVPRRAPKIMLVFVESSTAKHMCARDIRWSWNPESKVCSVDMPKESGSELVWYGGTKMAGSPDVQVTGNGFHTLPLEQSGSEQADLDRSPSLSDWGLLNDIPNLLDDASPDPQINEPKSCNGQYHDDSPVDLARRGDVVINAQTVHGTRQMNVRSDLECNAISVSESESEELDIGMPTKRVESIHLHNIGLDIDPVSEDDVWR